MGILQKDPEGVRRVQNKERVHLRHIIRRQDHRHRRIILRQVRVQDQDHPVLVQAAEDQAVAQAAVVEVPEVQAAAVEVGK